MILPPSHLYDTSDSRHHPVLGALLLVVSFQLLYARTSLVLGNFKAADRRTLLLAHAAVDVDVLDLDVQRAVAWVEEPAVDLPADVQEK